MRLNENIHNFRKENRLSQEELAEKVGVSRQTISNWELGETSPNPEQLIKLSKIYKMSIDKLVGNDIQSNNKKIDARIFSVCGTAINFIGLVVAIMIEIEEQVPSSVAVGLIFMAIGCVIFAIGQIMGINKNTARKYFWLVNIWFLVLMPFSCLFNMIDGLLGGFSIQYTPIPQLGNSYLSYALCWVIYIVICGFIDIIVLKKNK